jgi:hypothetical protein
MVAPSMPLSRSCTRAITTRCNSGARFERAGRSNFWRGLPKKETLRNLTATLIESRILLVGQGSPRTMK